MYKQAECHGLANIMCIPGGYRAMATRSNRAT